MRKHSFGSVLQGVYDITLHRLHLLRKDKISLGILISSILLFIVILQAFITSAEEQSALPIGIIDLDQTEESNEYLQRLDEVSALRVVRGEKKELEALLLDELIYAYFIIEDGFEDDIKGGEPRGLISVYYLSENRFATLLADILAGELMYPLTLYYTYDYYKTIPFDGTKLSQEEYIEYLRGMVGKSEDFDFSFDIKIVDQENEYQLDNSLIYNQMIFGMTGILISMIAMAYMAIGVKEKELGILGRLKISTYHGGIRDGGTILSFLLIGSVLSAIFSFLILNKIELLTGRTFLRMFLLMLEFAITMGGVYLFLGKCFVKMVTYQLLGTILVLITSILGFYQLISGFTGGIGQTLANIIPNNWFIQGFTDIIVKKDMDNLLFEGHKVLGIMMLGVLVVLYGTNLFLEKREDN